MLARKLQRTLIALAVTAVVGIFYLKTRASGPDYEVPEFTAKAAAGFDPAQHGYDAYTEIRDLLVQSPVVIFSKSYCPHSRFVKTLLTEQYRMSPPALVRELDLDPHGQEIQDALLEISGRRTVPNVFVGGKSLGGGDEMRLLHGRAQLVGAFKRNAGRKFGIKKVD